MIFKVGGNIGSQKLSFSIFPVPKGLIKRDYRNVPRPKKIYTSFSAPVGEEKISKAGERQKNFFSFQCVSLNPY